MKICYIPHYLRKIYYIPCSVRERVMYYILQFTGNLCCTMPHSLQETKICYIPHSLRERNMYYIPYSLSQLTGNYMLHYLYIRQFTGKEDVLYPSQFTRNKDVLYPSQFTGNEDVHSSQIINISYAAFCGVPRGIQYNFH